MLKMFYGLVLLVDGLMALIFWNSWVVTLPLLFLFSYLFNRTKIDPNL